MKIVNKKTLGFTRIHAHISGDGYTSVTRTRRSAKEQIDHPRKDQCRNRYYTRYVNVDQTLVEQFKKDVKSVFGRKVTTLRKHEYEVCGKWILDIMRENGALKSHTWFIPKTIMNAPKKIKKEWLKAFFDDEGWVGKCHIGLAVVNEKGIKQIIVLLKEFGINTKYDIYEQKNPNHRTRHEIRLRKEDTIKYYYSVGFSCPKKKNRLVKLIKKWGCWDSNPDQ
jgi:hypothetical protein